MDKLIFEENESEVRSYCRKFPIIFQKAFNANLISEDGTKYIDFLSTAGSLNYGHNNPYIKKAVMDYLHEDNVINLLDMHTSAKASFLKTFKEKILSPRKMDYKIMFCGSTGTNAVEASLKLARKNKRRSGIFAFSGAFHGMSLGSLSITTDKLSRCGAGVALENVTFIPYADKKGSIEYISSILEDDHSGVDIPAAIILETVQAEGGVNVADVEWLKKIREICDEYDILMIIDDIQVGNGRTGTFFSFERAGIVPDMVILSKSVSGFGIPMSLLLVKPELDIFEPAEHNGTFRGFQLAFVGGKAAIEYYDEYNIEDIVKINANIISEFIRNEICALDPRISYRGIGMIWGIDLINISTNLAKEVAHACFENQLIIEVVGRKDSVLKILPPLTIEESTLCKGLEILKEEIRKKIY